LVLEVFAYTDAACSNLLGSTTYTISGLVGSGIRNPYYFSMQAWLNGLGGVPSFLRVAISRETSADAGYSWQVLSVSVQEETFGAAGVTSLFVAGAITFGGVGSITVESWTAVTFAGTWTDYDTTVFSAAGYCKDPLGFVHLRGLVKRTGTGIGSGNPIFKLPAGYRPFRTKIFATYANDLAAQVRVDF
jgi:hypothetical protein